MTFRRPTVPPAAVLLCACAWSCSDSSSGGGDASRIAFVDGGAQDANVAQDAANPYPPVDGLDEVLGCQGVYNPDQVLDYQLTMSEGDLNTIRNDATNSIFVQAELSCDDLPPITVGVRRKRSGGTIKFGMKIDPNYYLSEQTYYGLHKLSLENGVSAGGSEEASAKDLIAEYLAWRLFVRSGAIAGRAALARVFVNGELLGVYVNVEQVDKVFLRVRLGEDNGWLYKKSGGNNDGYKTNLGLPNPHEAYFCFWDNNGCPMPSDAELARNLGEHLDIVQMLTFGAVNALMANRDAPIFKDNNYYFYDSDLRPRLYIPWDLDTAMSNGFDVFAGSVPGGTSLYRDALFSSWEDDYDAILSELLQTSLSIEAIEAELDAVVSVAGAAFTSDPHIGHGAAAQAVEDLKTWWRARHAEVLLQVEAH